MQTELNEVSLDTLGNGAAVELFNEELRKVLENIADPNTPWKQTRTVNLRIKITPNEERSSAAVEISAESKLAGVKPFGTFMFVGLAEGRVRAYEHNPKQPELPGMGKKVIDIKDRGGNA